MNWATSGMVFNPKGRTKIMGQDRKIGMNRQNEHTGGIGPGNNELSDI